MGAAFLSHSRQDRPVAETILRSLRDAGIAVDDVWGLIASAPHGVDIGAYLQEHLAAAQFFILLWSRAAAEAQTIKEDIRQAIDAWSSGKLLLATLDDTQLPLGLRDLAPVAIRVGPDGPDSRNLVDHAQRIVQQQTDNQIEPSAESARANTGPQAINRKSRLKRAALFFSLALAAFFLLFLFSFKESAAPLSQGPAYGILALLGAFILLLGAGIGALAFAIWQRLRGRRSLREAKAAQPMSAPVSANPVADHREVFVSYSRRNQQVVDQVVQEIEQVGFSVWIDRMSTGSGRYAAPIVQAIRSCKLVALMCSRDAFSSDHVIREIYVAGDNKKPFIVFQIDQSDFPDEVLYFTTGFPRVPVGDIDLTQLRSEINRIVAAQ